MHDNKGRKNKQLLKQYNLMQDKHILDCFSDSELRQPSHSAVISIIQLIVAIHYLHSILHESDRTLFLREENVDIFSACILSLDSYTIPASLQTLSTV